MQSLFLFAISLQVVVCLNILVYNPKASSSHVRTLGAITDTLAAAGHNVTTVMPVLDPSLHSNGTRLSRILLIPTAPAVADWNTANQAQKAGGIWTSNNNDPWQIVKIVREQCRVTTLQCAATLSHPGLVDSLRDAHFHFALAEPMDMCGFALFHLIGIDRYGLALTVGLMDHLAASLGLPAEVSYVPGIVAFSSDRMSFSERVMNLLTHHAAVQLGDIFNGALDSLTRELGLDVPPMADMIDRASVVFVNSDSLVDFPRPTLHKVVDIGGISVPPQVAPLSADWDAVLSLRPHTVLVSFGSVALSHLMPLEYKHTLTDVFKMFSNVTFIWKYEVNDGVAEGVENVVAGKWLPQQQLLADPRLSLFVTHAGLGSTHEALACGVPVVAIPIFADQMRNGAMLERLGTGVVLKKEDLAHADRVADAIGTVLGEQSYLLAARRTSRLHRLQPFSPQQRLIKAVEFAAKYAPLSHLNPHGRRLSWIQYYCIDVYATVAMVAVAIVTTYLVTLRFVFLKCVKAYQ